MIAACGRTQSQYQLTLSGVSSQLRLLFIYQMIQVNSCNGDSTENFVAGILISIVIIIQSGPKKVSCCIAGCNFVNCAPI